LAPQTLKREVGALNESACDKCGGRLLPSEGVAQVVQTEMGLSPDTLKELAGHFAGPAVECPTCHAQMSPLALRGVQVELCMRCGSLWLDEGDLAGLSGGRHGENALIRRKRGWPTGASEAPAPSLWDWLEKVIVGGLTRAEKAMIRLGLKLPPMGEIPDVKNAGWAPFIAALQVRSFQEKKILKRQRRLAIGIFFLTLFGAPWVLALLAKSCI
jgi:hypothetical protein